MFKSAAQGFLEEAQSRHDDMKRVCTYGMNYLDKALGPILLSDVVLLGARTGVGKTQFCVNLALANIQEGKRVHYFALEADENEIERRIKYSLMADYFYADPRRPILKRHLSYRDWIMGNLGPEIQQYEDLATAEFSKFVDLNIFYNKSGFGVEELIKSVIEIENETDLIILDHVHYFDFGSDTENKALKEIAMKVRNINQITRIPVVMVAHLRKGDRFNRDICPSEDEFHGSSELAKVATRIVTLARGEALTATKYSTFVRVAKSRIDSSPVRFLGEVIYDIKKNQYEKIFKIGKIVDGGKSFEKIEKEEFPYWML